MNNTSSQQNEKPTTATTVEPADDDSDADCTIVKVVANICVCCNEPMRLPIAKCDMGHVFHHKCIAEWDVFRAELNQFVNCPTCRQKFPKFQIDVSDVDESHEQVFDHHS